MANTPKVSQVFSAARYLFWLLFFFLVSVDLMVPRRAARLRDLLSRKEGGVGKCGSFLPQCL